MMHEILKSGIPDITEEQISKFERYYEMLLHWNSRMNLTAITDEEEVARKHFTDSAAAKSIIPEHANCIDVGTGAGFPGIPLLLLRPDIRMTLLDSLNKRLLFLHEVTEELGLDDRVQIVHARAEDAGQNPDFRGKYDIALSRAVAGLPVLLELTVPFLNKKGKSICYKGDAAEELLLSENACKKLNCKLEVMDVFSDYGARSLVIAERTGEMPKMYPRKAGTPSKNPL